MINFNPPNWFQLQCVQSKHYSQFLLRVRSINAGKYTQPQIILMLLIHTHPQQREDESI